MNQRNADDPLIWVYCGHCWTSFRRQHGRWLLQRQWRQTNVCYGRWNDDLLGGRRTTSACERRLLSLRSRSCGRALLRCQRAAASSVVVPFSSIYVLAGRRGSGKLVGREAGKVEFAEEDGAGASSRKIESCCYCTLKRDGKGSASRTGGRPPVQPVPGFSAVFRP